jgi:hypothetical protein
MDNQQQEIIDVIFRDIPDHDSIQVNSLGIIRNKYNLKVLKPYTDKDGYYRLKYWCKTKKKIIGIYCHRAVALAFIVNPFNKPQVNHIDSDRKNNHVFNLEWVTAKENSEHCRASGRTLKGENSPVNVYPVGVIHEVCRLLESGFPVTKIAVELNVDKNLAVKIKARETWVDVSSQYQIPLPKPQITEDVVITICKMLEEGRTAKEVEKSLSLGRGVASHIKLRKTFKHISKDYIW